MIQDTALERLTGLTVVSSLDAAAVVNQSMQHSRTANSQNWA